VRSIIIESSTRIASVFPVAGVILALVSDALLVCCKSAALSPSSASGTCPVVPLLISSTSLPCSVFELFIFSIIDAGIRGVFSVAISSVLVIGSDGVDTDTDADA